MVLSNTVGGSNHDYKLLKQSGFADNLPPKVEAIVDLGFQGIEKDYPSLKVSIPDKKPKGGELTIVQSPINRRVSSIRVVVEHSISGVKRLRAVSDIYRNRKPGTDDRLILVSCGIWNFHLKMVA